MQKIVPHEIFLIYFSPYSAHAITLNGKIYPTVEHAYQCSRYVNEDIIEEIRSAKSPLLAWEISSRNKHQQIMEFQDLGYKVEIMKSLMKLKVEQHKDVRNALLESNGMVIVKRIFSYPPGDGFWDDGHDGQGQNQTGKLWMEIRQELNVTD